ncbi:MAG: hypothetical protein AAF250_16405 [Pseudomonadota bacterium]
MFVSAFLSILGLGFLVYAMFALAVYALPFAVALTVGMYLYDTDAGAVTAIVVALLAGGFTLVLGQVAFASIKSAPVRFVIGILYAAPAAIAGYSVVKGLSQIGGASEGWTMAFAIIGGIIVSGTAWMRIASLAGPLDEDDRLHPNTAQADPVANDR